MTGDTPQSSLKTLEEPPPATVIILILPRARAVPATVLSRCQVVRFAPRDAAGAAPRGAQARQDPYAALGATTPAPRRRAPRRARACPRRRRRDSRRSSVASIVWTARRRRCWW